MARITRMTRKRLGDVLIEQGLVDETAVKQALREQRRTGELLGEVLVRLGFVTEIDIAGAIVTQFALPYLRLSQYDIEPGAFNTFSKQMMRQYRFIPLDRMGGVLPIAVGGLLNEDVLNELEKVAGCKILVYITTQSDIRDALDRAFPDGAEGAGEPAEEGQTEAESLARAAVEQLAAQPDEGDKTKSAKEEDLEENLSSLGSMLLGDEE